MTLLENIQNTLKDLIEKGLQPIMDNIDVNFATPDDKFAPSSSAKATINVFLYDIRENLELRVNHYIQNTQKKIQSCPTNVNFSYIITVWTDTGDEKTDIQTNCRILSSLMQILLSHPELPEFGECKITPSPKMQILNPANFHGIGEFWQALKHNPKPLIHCTITAPLYPDIRPQYMVSDIDILLSNKENLIKGEIYIEKRSTNNIRQNKIANIPVKVEYMITEVVIYYIDEDYLNIYITDPKQFKSSQFPIKKGWHNFRKDKDIIMELDINEYNTDINKHNPDSFNTNELKIYYLNKNLETSNAQNAEYKIELKIDSTKYPLPSLKVKVISASQKLTTSNGHFTFSGLPTIKPDEYQLRFISQDQQLCDDSLTLKEITDPLDVKVILNMIKGRIYLEDSTKKLALNIPVEVEYKIKNSDSTPQKLITSNGDFILLGLLTIRPEEYQLIFTAECYNKKILEGTEIQDSSNIEVVLTKNPFIYTS